MATVEVLERAGCEVTFDERQTCCGSRRSIPDTEAKPENSPRDLSRYLKAQTPRHRQSIGIVHAMVKHFHELFPDEPDWRERAKRVADKTHELGSFLVNVLGIDDVGAVSDCKATWHDACHGLRDLGIHDEPRRLLNKVKDSNS
jgi:L-lactate dehydrogenase complex protein LldE